jgi:hypothetical protein
MQYIFSFKGLAERKKSYNGEAIKVVWLPAVSGVN